MARHIISNPLSDDGRNKINSMFEELYELVLSAPGGGLGDADNIARNLAIAAKSLIDEQGISVISKGAKADGISIDSAAIKNALATAKSSKVKKVLIPDGTYVTDETILVPRGIHLELGQNAVLKPNAGNFHVLQIEPEARASGGVIDTRHLTNFTAACIYLNSKLIFQFYEQTHMISDINLLGRDKSPNWTGTAILVEAIDENTYIDNVKFNNVTATNFSKMIHLRTNPNIPDVDKWVWINANYWLQCTFMNYHYGVYIEGSQFAEIAGNQFMSCQFQSEPGSIRMIYCDGGSNNIFDIISWDVHKPLSKVAFEFGKDTRWNEVRSVVAQEEFVIIDEGYLNNFVSAADYVPEKASKFHNPSMPYTPNFLGNQDDYLVNGVQRGYVITASEFPYDGELESLLQFETGYGCTWDTTNASYDEPIRIEIDLTSEPIESCQMLTIVCPEKAYPKDAVFSMRDASTGEWEEVHWVANNRFQSIIVSPPWAGKDLCDGLRIDFHSSNLPNNHVHIARIMATSSGNRGQAFASKGGDVLHGNMEWATNDIGPVLTQSDGKKVRFYVTPFGAMTSVANPYGGILPDHPQMMYPMSRPYRPNFIGEQDNILAYANLRGITITQTSTHPTQYGTLDLLFNTDGEDSVRWNSTNATEADPITLEVDLTNDDSMTIPYQFCCMIGLMSTYTNYPKNVIIEAWDDYSNPAEGVTPGWKEIHRDNDVQYNVIVSAPYENVQILKKIRVKFWGANNTRNEIALCRIFAHSTKTEGKAWLPKRGGKVDGNLQVKGLLDAKGGFVAENRTTDPASPAIGRVWFRTDLPVDKTPLRISTAAGIRAIMLGDVASLISPATYRLLGGGTALIEDTTAHIAITSLANGNGLGFAISAPQAGTTYNVKATVRILQNVDDRITMHIHNVTQNKKIATSMVNSTATPNTDQTLSASFTLSAGTTYTQGDAIELQIVQSWMNTTHDNMQFRVLKAGLSVQ
ncbi:glycosyl hydrolase family 28-related protein [Metabacillus indicus]|uniref:glycosyl hydrolase family 28-related protein n=1 Tax=Metabacillus indicus TaxID=246786 RepID=UPI002A07934F|nr:glycosyl hydrolase family 28-related protein [Metabacillus indicus]MDX8288830.1 glycosyl hydrolase family 28-related protein [Metabacillus indicus]